MSGKGFQSDSTKIYLEKPTLDVFRLGFICQILHNIFHDIKIASSGEIINSDFTVWVSNKG